MMIRSTLTAIAVTLVFITTHQADARQYHAPLVRVAQKDLGSGPQDLKLHRKTLWCATALNKWLKQLGYTGTNSDRAISFKTYGRQARTAQVGSIAVLPHHVGVVVADLGDRVKLISGNYSHRVGIGTYKKSQILAYRVPSESRATYASLY